MRSRSTVLLVRLLAVTALPSTLPAAADAQWGEQHHPFHAGAVVTGSLTRMDRLCDFDGDGRIDAIGSWRKPDLDRVVRGFRNDGRGRLLEAWSFTVPGANTSIDDIRPARLDRDHRDDFVFVVGGGLYAFLSAGAATPTPYDQETLASAGYEAAAGDFDGDGDDDVVVSRRHELSLFVNDGTGLVASGSVAVRLGDLRSGELTGDGVPDVCVCGPDGKIRVFSVVGGALRLGATIEHGLGPSAPHLAIGDVDGDRAQDIVVFDSVDYAVLRRTGPDSFAASPKARGGPATDLADIDGDGDLDGICCSGGGPGLSPHNSQKSFFEIALNDGNGAFAPAMRIRGLGAKHIAGAMDLEGDGDVDLIAGRAVLYNRGNHWPTPPTSSPRGRFFAHADVDGDGDQDLHPRVDGIYLNDGAGGYESTPPVIPDPPAGTRWIGPGWYGDFDGDGDADFLVGHLRDQQFLTMRTLENRSGGGFVDGGPATEPGVWFNPGFFVGFATNGMPHEGLVRDADGDGDLDIFVNGLTTTANPRCDLWRNDGTGFFSKSASSTLPAEHVQAVVDLDGDRHVDLVALSESLGRVTVHLGLGGGAFGAGTALAIAVDQEIDRVAAADFDGDGDVDVLGIDRAGGGAANTGRVVLYANDGSASFARVELGQPVINYAFGNVAYAGDLNGDAIADAMVYPAPNAKAAASLFLSANGVGSSVESVQAVLPGTVIDVDGDGDLDLKEWGLGTAVNTTFHGPAAGARLQYGTAGVGSGGFRPTLGAAGAFRVGERAATLLRGAPGGALFSYQFGLGRTATPDFPLPGMVGYALPYLLSFTFVADGALGEAGSGSLEIAYVVPASAAGVTLFQQVHVLDPGVPGLLNYTNGLRSTFGR